MAVGPPVGDRSVGRLPSCRPAAGTGPESRNVGRQASSRSTADVRAGGRSAGWCVSRGPADGPLARVERVVDGRRGLAGWVSCRSTAEARAGGGGAVGRHRGAGAVVEPPVGERAVSRQLSFRPSAGSPPQGRRPVHTPVSGRAGAVHHVPARRTARSTGARPLWHGSDRSGTGPGIPVHPCDDSRARSRHGSPPRGGVAADTSTQRRRDGRTVGRSYKPRSPGPSVPGFRSGGRPTGGTLERKRLGVHRRTRPVAPVRPHPGN
ncbi:hypothetical protein SALBM217S_00193 [Streptomyces griseoloalbus]